MCKLEHRPHSSSADAIATTRPPAADHMARLPAQVLTSSPQCKLHQLFQPPVMPPVLHQKPVAALYRHNCAWQTDNPRPPTALCRRLKESRSDWILLILRRKFIFRYGRADRWLCLATPRVTDLPRPRHYCPHCMHHTIALIGTDLWFVRLATTSEWLTTDYRLFEVHLIYFVRRIANGKDYPPNFQRKAVWGCESLVSAENWICILELTRDISNWSPEISFPGRPGLIHFEPREPLVKALNQQRLLVKSLN